MNYAEFVKERLTLGETPNDITRRIEETLLSDAQDWALFGDGEWRSDTCCSKCGLWVAGICGHENDPDQEVILRSEYERRKAVTR